jgi:hypothetical protein
MIRSLNLVLALFVAMGCTSGGDGTAPASITCHTQYRPDAESLTGAAEPTLTVDRVDETSPQPERLDFATLSVEVAFHGDAPEGNNVTMVVTTPDGEPLIRNLYQYTDGTELTTAFAGGHGFTGLHYVFHEGSSLQVWCESDAT